MRIKVPKIRMGKDCVNTTNEKPFVASGERIGVDTCSGTEVGLGFSISTHPIHIPWSYSYTII